ncbi:MAG: DUF4845 domain-containing protein [Steroidobacteraceae bacterium]
MNDFKTRDRQRGATALGMLTILIILGLGLYALIRLVPVYLEYFEITRAMEGISKETSAADTSPDKIRTGLNRRWNIEDIKTLDYKDIQIRKVGSTYEMTAEYRAEVPFIGNVSLVADFYKTVTVD